MHMLNHTLSLAIMSGKGGVGKTNIALNLGYALHRAGGSVVMMDCDLGLANLDVLLGLSPEKTMQDLLLPDLLARDIVIGLESPGLDFLPAASGVPELVSMDEDMQAILYEKLNALFGAYQYLVLDLGAGISQTVLSFAAMAHLRVAVITPEPTSLTDCYALIKVLVTQYGVRDFHILVNMVGSGDEALQTFERLRSACQKFLEIDPAYLGHVRQDPAVPEAVRRQAPLFKLSPESPACRDLQAVAARLQHLRLERGAAAADQPVLRVFPSLKVG